jgi:hypothetical protein
VSLLESEVHVRMLAWSSDAPWDLGQVLFLTCRKFSPAHLTDGGTETHWQEGLETGGKRWEPIRASGLPFPSPEP